MTKENNSLNLVNMTLLRRMHRESLRINPTHKALIIWHLMFAYYYFCTSYAECALDEKKYQLVDLTHVFDNDTIYWVTEPNLILNVTYNGTLPDKDIWYQKEQIYAPTHGGTHMDAPCHFARGRWCVSDIPLERLVVKAAVVDISSNVNGNPDVHLTKEMLLEWENDYGRIPNESLLLVNTGWSQFWPDRVKYLGTQVKEISSLKFPSIKGEAAEWLVAERNIVGVGIDVMSVDIPNERPTTHVTLMSNNIYGLENVNNLDKLPPIGATVYVMPMKLKDASGAPCRLVAQVGKGPFSSSNRAEINVLLTIAAIFVVSYIYRI